ncbi:MAG: immXl [Verrucomicrobiales bacterium]|nr:immXl [Verrucomicrobiales bacterium]
MDDAQRLLDWRNDLLTRAMSKTVGHVEMDTHVAWLTARLERADPQLFIAEVEGEPVGTFRLDDDEISFTIAPLHRGRGYAKQMLCMAREMFGSFRAEVKRDNLASARAAAAAGHRVELI